MNLAETYRQATNEEKIFYTDKLYPLQDKVLLIAKLFKDVLYLSGGTALSRYFIKHRYSDDLDFFTTSSDIQIISTNFSDRLKESGFSVREELNTVYFSRIFVLYNDVELKVEFVREHNHYGDYILENEGFQLNNLYDMGGNKITAFEDRAEIKDIIDLYYITKQIPLEKLFEIADLKRVPVMYEQLLTINQFGITGKALTEKEIPPEELNVFIDYLKAATEEEVKKKEILALENIERIVKNLLWDFPPEDRNINKYSKPVLSRRLNKIPLPQRRVLERLL